LSGGPFGIDPWRFFGTLAAVRLIRLGAEGGLAGELWKADSWMMESRAFEYAIGALAIVALIGTTISAISAIAVWRSTHAAPPLASSQNNLSVKR
jgi:hypothetical protein